MDKQALSNCSTSTPIAPNFSGWVTKESTIDRKIVMKRTLDNIPTNERLLRLPEVLKIIPVSKSSWWAGVKTGRYPEPNKLGPRTTCWRLSDIQAITLAGAS